MRPAPLNRLQLLLCISFEINKFEKFLERSIVRDRSIKFFPGPHWKRGKNFIGWVNTVNTTIGKAGLTHFQASLQSNSTFSFKHHLTGEAWPGCSIQYLFIQTPLDRRSILGMVSVYRTYVHCCCTNVHLNIVLQAELYVRTGTYDRPKNTPVIDSACAPLDSALAIDAPGAVEPLVY